MRYIGGKYKLLNVLIPNFYKCGTFVDLFGDGLNVAVNVDYEVIYANDRIDYLIELYHYFQDTNVSDILEQIYAIIENYQLSKWNKDAYLRFRDEYNKNKNPLMLYVLTCYSYNHQIRFNNSFEFNTSFGYYKSDFNNDIAGNLICFCKALQQKQIRLTNCDFREFDFSVIPDDSMIYCDPPYTISTGSYNDGTRGFGNWTERDDLDLMNLLDRLDEHGIRFCMSNTLSHRNSVNVPLVEWSKKYIVSNIDMDY